MSGNSSSGPRRWLSSVSPSNLKVASWFTPALATDWLASLILLVIGRRLADRQPFQQPIKPFVGDPTLQYDYVPVDQQTISGEFNIWLTLMLPLAIMLLISIGRRSAKEAHHAALGLISGYIINDLVTNFIKGRVGRFRPDFFARCQWDATREICTGIPAMIQEGRRSFPSGHSSSAFYGCVFLVLFLAGKSRAFTFASTLPHSGTLYSRLLKLGLAIWPLFLCFFIAISRWEDHWHHPTDIIAGSVIGTILALIIYHIYHPTPFLASNYEIMAYPRKTHRELADDLMEDGIDTEEEALLGDERV